ncbi:hypothetical protein [Desulfosporosinus sp. SB140]|uniref:hypothetical protein n=1 Tax=Desulfosporosinus paludis TaxID=3115649 RepID=UPI00388EECF9
MIELEKSRNPGHFDLMIQPLKASHNVETYEKCQVADADGSTANDLFGLMILLNKNNYVLVESEKYSQFAIQTKLIVRAKNSCS